MEQQQSEKPNILEVVFHCPVNTRRQKYWDQNFVLLRPLLLDLGVEVCMSMIAFERKGVGQYFETVKYARKRHQESSQLYELSIQAEFYINVLIYFINVYENEFTRGSSWNEVKIDYIFV